MIFEYILIHFVRCFVAQFQDEAEDFEQINNVNGLYTELFTKRSYNRYVYPFNGKSQNTTMNKLHVHFDLWYIKLLSLDAESQLLSVNLELKMFWRDPRLVWDPVKFNGTDNIFVSTEILWIPDSQIGNAKTLDSIKAGEAVRSAQIFSNGTIYFPVFYYTKVACPIIINTFPFDRQLCPIPLMSLIYDEKYILTTVSVDPFLFQLTGTQAAKALAESTLNLDLKDVSSNNGLAGVMISKEFLAWGNGEWDVTNISAVSASQGGMTMIAYLLSIRRVPNFYVYVIATPCFILTTLSIMGLFWTPNIKKEQLVKLTIGLTSLVSMTVLLQMLSDAIPKTAVFPLLGIYVVCCVGIISLASVVITLHCLPNPRKHHDQQDSLRKKTESSQSSRVTRFILNILHSHLFFLLFFQLLNLIGFIVFFIVLGLSESGNKNHEIQKRPQFGASMIQIAQNMIYDCLKVPWNL